MRVRKKSFERAICDEVQLEKDAKNLVETYLKKGHLPPFDAKVLSNISAEGEYSPDLVARIFYESILQSNHKKFIDQLSNYSTINKEEDKPQLANIKILLIPGMFYKEHPETGSDGELALEIAKKFGFEICLVPIESGGSISTNSAIIEATLEQENHPNIWLVSISKGTSDVRHYLQNTYMIKKDNDNIKGWINVAGIPKGLPYANYRLSNSLKRFVLRVLSPIFSVDYQALHELKADHHFWQKQKWPNKIEMIHLLPIPHSSHLQDFLRKKYHKTLELAGPNEGLVPVTDILDFPGHIVPIWGCDHFMRTPKMSVYLYQLYTYIATQSKDRGDL